MPVDVYYRVYLTGANRNIHDIIQYGLIVVNPAEQSLEDKILVTAGGHVRPDNLDQASPSFLHKAGFGNRKMSLEKEMKQRVFSDKKISWEIFYDKIQSVTDSPLDATFCGWDPSLEMHFVMDALVEAGMIPMDHPWPKTRSLKSAILDFWAQNEYLGVPMGDPPQTFEEALSYFKIKRNVVNTDALKNAEQLILAFDKHSRHFKKLHVQSKRPSSKKPWSPKGAYRRGGKAPGR
jgi:hypothetical protein